MPGNENESKIEFDEDGEQIYPIGDHPPEVWERITLLHWAQMAGRDATTAIMRFGVFDLPAVQRIGTWNLYQFFGDWDGDPTK